MDHCAKCLNLFCDKVYCAECDCFIPRRDNPFDVPVNKEYCICEYHENRE